ncbi:copper resistance protein CopC [Spongisporangium articulatum]|uniref:Copper resistance protein CopC n=1 Tax=Spongisporangium articulatum TaxID=3362603 RepID=A0ABW8ATD6_9ACTN
MRLVRLLLAAGLAVGTLLVGAPTASAHATLLGTTPATGSTVAKVPAQVTLHFNQPVLGIGATVLVVGPEGDEELGKPALVDTDVTEAIRPGAPAGSYSVEWRVTSNDGHPIGGSFFFTATKAGGGDGTAARAPAGQPEPAGSSVAAPQVSTAGESGGLPRWALWALIAVGVLGVVGAAVVSVLTLRDT